MKRPIGTVSRKRDLLSSSPSRRDIGREREKKKKKKKGNQSNPSSPFCSWLGALLESRETSDSIITKGETAKANGTEWDALICLFRKEIKNRKRNSIRVLKLDFSISPLPQVAVVTIYGKSRVSS